MTTTDYQLLLHVLQFHQDQSEGLAKDPAHMSGSVMPTLWQSHTSWHNQHPHKHEHDWFATDNSGSRSWPGITYREGPNGLDHRTGIWLFTCPVSDCFVTVSAGSEEAAKLMAATHKCPVTGMTHYGVSVTLTMVEEVWAAADREYDKLIDSNPTLEGDRLQQQRGVLKGLCLSLTMFMQPRFADYNAVADEVRKRRTMREHQQEYTTPGLGMRRFSFPTPETEKAEAEKMSPKSRAEKVLTPEIRNAIKHAHKQMPTVFTHEVLAKQYDCSVAVVAEVCS